MGKELNAEELALRYLTYQMRTEEEVRTHLKKKGVAAEDIEKTIVFLCKKHYIDDQIYAETFFRHGFEKHRGALRLCRELEKRGVKKETVENACEDYMYENRIDENEEALKVAWREIFHVWPEENPSNINWNDKEETVPVNEKKIASIARKLEYLGYSSNTIYHTIDRVRNWRVQIEK